MEATTTSLLLLSTPTTTRSSPCGGFCSPLVLPRLPCNICSTFRAKQQHLVCLGFPRLNRKSSCDGDWRHIGYKVPRPGAFEIVSDSVTIGRVTDKVDIVLRVATVSGTHARLEKDGKLLVTNLDSTNGTYINERRLVPGFPIPVDPGSLLIFGDIHLAMFCVSKMIVKVPSKAEGDEQETKTEAVSAAVEEITN